MAVNLIVLALTLLMAAFLGVWIFLPGYCAGRRCRSTASWSGMASFRCSWTSSRGGRDRLSRRGTAHRRAGWRVPLTSRRPCFVRIQ